MKKELLLILFVFPGLWIKFSRKYHCLVEDYGISLQCVNDEDTTTILNEAIIVSQNAVIKSKRSKWWQGCYWWLLLAEVYILHQNKTKKKLSIHYPEFEFLYLLSSGPFGKK